MNGARAQPVLLAVCGLLLLFGGCGDDSSDSAARPAAPTTASAMSHFEPGADASAPARRIVPAATPLPKPTAPLPADTTCVTSQCHADLVNADHVHAPVSSSDCAVCHAPDTGDHHYPLLRTGNDTCTFCHSPYNTQAHQHPPVSQTGCVTCHDPHRSNTNYLINRPSVGELCQSCHQLPLESNAHSAYAAGECIACHQPHQSNAAHLLRGGEGPKHCLSCHTDLAEQLASADNTAHGPVTQDCVTCHSPHTSSVAHLLRQPVAEGCLSCHDDMAKHIAQVTVPHGAVATDDTCLNCHDAHVSAHAHLLKSREDRLCTQCHDRPITAPDGRVVPAIALTLGRKFLHGPVQSGDCSSCHDAHGADQPELLRRTFPDTFYTSFKLEQYDLCFGCHSPDLVLTPTTTDLTGFRNGDRNLHFVHVNRADKGRTCRTCHAVHGSDLPRHMASSVPFEGSDWAMPIRFQLTADGGTCAPGCHETMRYNRAAGGDP